MQNKTLWGAFALVAVLVVTGAALYVTRKTSFHGAVINPPIQAADIQLTDHNGQQFQLSTLKGKVVILYFGYTNCHEECPLTMAHLKEAFDALGEKSKDVQVVMISTDPARDTQAALKEFLRKFNPTFLGVTGTPDELAKAWSDYGVTVLDNGETHSNYIYVIDRSGYLRLTFLPDTSPDDESADLKMLLTEK